MQKKWERVSVQISSLVHRFSLNSCPWVTDRCVCIVRVMIDASVVCVCGVSVVVRFSGLIHIGINRSLRINSQGGSFCG